MKQSTIVAAVIIEAAALMALTPLLNAQSPKLEPEFQVLSVKQVAYAETAFRRTNFSQDETGLVVILKRASTADLTTVHGNEFVLAFDSDDDIPRRPCMGISSGMKSPDDRVTWGVLGDVTRYWIKPGEPYFALLFSAPKNVSTFTLYRAVPYSKPFQVKTGAGL